MRAAVVAVLLSAVGCGGRQGSDGADGGAVSASCVAPFLDDVPPGAASGGASPTASPGDSQTVYGHWYTSTCNDTGGDDPLVPLAPVHLTLTLPGGAVRDLGTFTPAGQDMGFAVSVRVPAGTPAGIARVHDDQERPATFSFPVGGSSGRR